ncbi:UxaA family hydrolase [Vibrio penaeicida]|uniref:Hydrolase n=1 Tax=Vibrio penaeicida TaxID=104609 RepID=A0AAV5NT51_9VIBR|nr:UxaA family hydrolase [Vibrio penaeicida]RTZ21850.1 altronate hydrolase [Vibrio penaeicida]GLQ73668.1 hydrolase [Vibrio penaeicida]
MASVILLKEDDNVLIACRELRQQEVVTREGSELAIEVKQPTPVGFKVARMALKKGTLIIKYGVPIGRCSADVDAGELIHTHNLHSQYIPSHQRGGHVHE